METGQTPDFWNSYWRSGSDAAYAVNGPLQSLLDRFWLETAQKCIPHTSASILDIASGAGAASRALERGLAPAGSITTLCDLSWHALKHAPGHHSGVLAHAAQLPFRSASFDIAISQFGLEYAGASALAEATRVIKPNGFIALLIHHKLGALQAENQRNLVAAEAFLESDALPAFSRFAGALDMTARANAESDFARAVKLCAETLHQLGRDVAGGSLLQIYRDLAVMHSRIELQNNADVRIWCADTQAELKSYVKRMRQMLLVSMGREEIEGYLAFLNQCGFEATVGELRPEPSSSPVAWILSGRKS